MNPSPTKALSQSPYFTRKITTIPSQDVTECPICLQSVKVRGKISCCNHIFCYECIFEWSKVTNSCPLCKAVFHEIEKCSKFDGNKWKEDNQHSVIQVEDKKQDNNILVQEFIYDDDFLLNEYVQDDFLVSDDAPILYETQATETSSLVNLQHYDSSRTPSLSLELESDSSPPRRRYSRRQRIRQSRISSQEIEWNQHESAYRLLQQQRRRRRQAIIQSDSEEEVDDADDDQMNLVISESVSNQDSIPHTPSLPPTQTLHDDESVLQSEPSAGATPVLFFRDNTIQSIVETPPPKPPDMVCSPEVFPNSCEESQSRPTSKSLFQSFSKYFLNPIAGRRSYSDSVANNLHIVPETPLREKRCRSESDRFLRDKMSHMF